MAIFAAKIRSRGKNQKFPRLGHTRDWRRTLGAALVALPAFALACPASAQTTTTTSGTVGNNGLASGGAVLQAFFGYGGLLQPNDTDGTQFVPLGDASFGFIKNPYIGVVVGLAGSYGVTWPAGTTTVTATHNVSGMLSFGNTDIGSARFATDNFQALNGAQYFGAPYEAYQSNGRPFGYGVWPLPGWWEITNGGAIQSEYSAYARLLVDNTVTNVLGSNGFVVQPQLINNVLNTTYDAGNNISCLQQIRLYRSTAQLRWVFTNNDTAPHTIRLRFTVNVRANAFDGATDNSRTGFYFVDGNGLVSDNARVLTGSAIPDQLSIYGKRYEVDSTTDPPFAARHILRGFGATAPQRIVIATPFELRPNTGGFDFPPFTFLRLDDGLATGVYYGPYVLQPGQSQEIITYYGNGNPTDLPNNDFVVSADGPEALAYNADAANDPAILGKVGVNAAEAIPKFLSPSPFRIYGSIYNQVPSNPQTAINLTNVRASLTLPMGLAFDSDTAEKVLGNDGTLPSDRGSDTSWAVKPTGEAFGTLAYQINVTTNEFGSRQITRSINIPATPFRSVTANTFQMIGFPFEFDPINSNNGDPATVINGLTSPADDPVVFFQYQPDPQNASGFGRYVIANRLQNGIGYFYRPSLSRTIFAKGVKPLKGQANTGLTNFTDVSQRQISLSKGWNIISNPYVYNIPLRSLRFTTNTNQNATSQNFEEAVSSGLVRGGVFFRNVTTNSYDFFDDSTQPLRPWEGYWMYLNSDLTLIYSVPTQRQSAILSSATPGNEPVTRGVMASGKALVANPTLENWRLQLVARQGSERSDAATLIGVNSSTAVKESDRVLPKPPAQVSDYVYVGIVKPESNATRFAKDIRTASRSNEWEVEVSADHDGPVTVTWPNIGTLPRRISLSLKDKETGRSYAMRSSSSVTVNVKKDKPTRLVVTAKQQSAQPLVITNLRAVGTRGAGRSFVFHLSREATINGVVKTIAGKTVATLAVSRAATAGENRLQWTGRAQNGSPIPPGPYVIEIIAQDGDGEIAPAKRPFMTIE